MQLTPKEVNATRPLSGLLLFFYAHIFVLKYVKAEWLLNNISKSLRFLIYNTGQKGHFFSKAATFCNFDSILSLTWQLINIFFK